VSVQEAELFFRTHGPQPGKVPKKWHGPITVEGMAAEIGMTPIYEGAYRGLSSLEHSDVMAYLPLIRGGPGNLRVAFWSDQLLPFHLGMGLGFFAYLFKVWNDELHMADPDALDRATAAATEMLSAEFRPSSGP